MARRGGIRETLVRCNGLRPLRMHTGLRREPTLCAALPPARDADDRARPHLLCSTMPFISAGVVSSVILVPFRQLRSRRSRPAAIDVVLDHRFSRLDPRGRATDVDYEQHSDDQQSRSHHAVLTSVEPVDCSRAALPPAASPVPTPSSRSGGRNHGRDPRRSRREKTGSPGRRR
jgi:hypothetical protein